MRSNANAPKHALALAALAGLTLAACAGSQRAPATSADPQSPRQARHELQRLERQIDSHRLALGLPARAPATEIAAKDRSVSGGEDKADGRAEPRPAAPPAPADDANFAPEAEPDQQPPAKVAAPVSASDAGQGACSESCKLSKAICHASARICSIADYLGEAAAAARCQRSKQDCRQARKVTRGDCSACK